MKKLSEILAPIDNFDDINESVAEVQAEEYDDEVDSMGDILSQLEDICQMSDEIYETVSELDDISDDCRDGITKIYSDLDDLYELIDSKYDIVVDSDEYEMSTNESLDEEFNTSRFRQLASTGLISKEDLPKLVLAMQSMSADKVLSQSQKDIVNSTFQTLIAIILGDTAILSKVKSAVTKM